MKRFAIILTVSLLVLAAGVIPALASTEVGKYHAVSIDSARHYQGSPNGEIILAWEQTIHHPGATFISIHFKDFHLADGDYLAISDPQGGQAYTLTGKGKMDMEDFWARHIKGDTAVLNLFATNRSGGPGFIIDTYSAGFQSISLDVSIDDDIESPITPLSTCGASDFENAICYDGTTEYNRARAVARLLIRGRSLCTGWLVSAEGHFITNQHCIDEYKEYADTDYEFMAEAPDCGSSNGQMQWPGNIYDSGVIMHTTNASKDYTLLQFTGANPADVYGYLQLDNRPAAIGERIYLASHPLGYAKMLVLNSDVDNGYCKVNAMTTACTGSTAYQDVGYYCDSEGGSSGSPVLAASTHKVIALHHCGTCLNRGVPINEIYPEIIGFLGDPEPDCDDNSDCDDDAWCNGTETCVGGFCVNGTDPCPDLCDEGGDFCYTTCGDSTCDPGEGEDQCSCPEDCGYPPASEVGVCTDDVDNDCDGNTDCDDPDCDADAACDATCLDYGEVCTDNSDCCSGSCWWRRGAYTCR